MATNQVQVSDELIEIKRVYFTGTDTLRSGYSLCFDADSGVAANADNDRAFNVEKPSATNLRNYAGVVTPRHDNIIGPAYVDVYVPNRRGQKVLIWTEESCTIDTTVLTLKAGSYAAGGVGEGPVIAKAMQTVDRSSTNGTVQALLVGINPSEIAKSGANGGAGPSPAIWDSCPWAEMVIDPSLGYTFYDDFISAPVMASATAQGPYLTYQDAGVTVAPLETSDEIGGVIEIANNDADNDEGHIGLGANATFNMMKIASTSGKACWFEARLKKAGVGNDGVAIFVGVGEEGFIAAEGLVDNTGEVADKDFVGFQVLNADGDSLVPCYKKNGQTKQTGTAVAITADTYVNVGFYFDGSTLTGYVDGVLKLTVTDVSAATFPDGEEMTMILLSKVGSAAELAVQMDWWRFAQLR